jgi:putative DNA primase/helicase
MNQVLRSWAFALGGVVSGNSVLAPGPGHRRTDRSMSLTVSAGSSDGFVVFSHAGDDWKVCRDYVRARLGMGAFQPKQVINIEQRPEDIYCELALKIWHQSADSRGTVVELYLKSRGLELPDEAAKEAIRFHSNCYFRGERLPTMVCLVRNIVTNEPQGIHRTALTMKGTAVKRDGKTFRLSLGAVAGGAIKLDPNEDVTMGLCIGEGVETCLSGRMMGYRPVWSVLSTGGIAAFPVLPGINGLTIFGEHDARGSSEKAISACAERWLGAGKDVRAEWPMSGNDLNDEVRSRHAG